MQKWNTCDLVIWVDENYFESQREGLPVSPVTDLKTSEFDYIVIAALTREEAENIHNDLIQRGHHTETILWERPLEP